MIDKVYRAFSSLAGPVMFSAANFMLALALQRTASASEFGVFAFIQVLIGAAMGLSHGLFAGPLNVVLAERVSADLISSFRLANIAFCLFSAAVIAAIAMMASADSRSALTIALLAISVLLRWFQRSLALAGGDREIAQLMDVVYAIVIGCGAGLLWWHGLMSFEATVVAQTVASLISMCVGRPRGVRLERGVASLVRFRDIFARHGKWALAANTAAQVAVNVHVYVITFVLGPAAFAPVALAALLFRPLGVVLTGLVQFEQPRMAARIADSRIAALDADISFVGSAAAWAWGANVLLLLLVAIVAPTMIAINSYEPMNLGMAMLLTGLVVLVRALREPKVTALQAAGRFRDVAVTNATCAPISFVLSLLLAIIFPSLSALAVLGSLAGEVVSFAMVTRRFGLFRSGLLRVA